MLCACREKEAGEKSNKTCPRTVLAHIVSDCVYTSRLTVCSPVAFHHLAATNNAVQQVFFGGTRRLIHSFRLQVLSCVLWCWCPEVCRCSACRFPSFTDIVQTVLSLLSTTQNSCFRPAFVTLGRPKQNYHQQTIKLTAMCFHLSCALLQPTSVVCLRYFVRPAAILNRNTS
jgi:hypothetical protein